MDVRWLLLQLAVSAALAGLCWTVQLAVYPRFAPLIAGDETAAGRARFAAYHAAYTRGIGWVAGPLMVAELALALAWAARGASPAQAAGAWFGAALAGLLWAQTFGVMVPLHARLQRAPSVATARRLTAWNWPRTALWTLRAGLLGAQAAAQFAVST